MENVSLYLLLGAYWQAMDAVTVAMERTDTEAHGTLEREAAFSAQFEEGERLNEAEAAIAAFLPTFKAEARIKAQFLEHLAAENLGTLDAHVIEALLPSLSKLVQSQDGRASA